MKKSKKFILAVLVILLVALGLVIANPDWVDSKEEVTVEVSEEVEDTHNELENELFD
jgi:sensor domain CHASE-containing protein